MNSDRSDSRRKLPLYLRFARIGIVGFILLGALATTAVAGAQEATVTTTEAPTDMPVETPTEVPPVDTPVPTEEPTSEAPGDTAVPTEVSTAAETATLEPTPALPPTIQSDKADYAPGDKVTLSGANWQPGELVVIYVNDDAGQTWNHSTSVTANKKGEFKYHFWLPDWFVANYSVRATGEVSGVATTTFTDLSIGTYDQCSNDDGDGYATGNTGCRWINGNLQSNNSIYFEGDATVQRVWLTDLTPDSTHTLTLKYGTTKGGKHAYDFLTTWDWSEGWIAVADRCEDITGCTTASETALDIPEDPNVPNSFEPSAPGDRQFTMRGGALNSATTPTVVSGSYGGDSETVITVTFTVGPSSGAMCSTKQGVTTCGIALWFGAHVAAQANWGLGQGAGSISGSPYHVALDAVDGAAVGQRDNQMQAGVVTEIPNGTIVIVKDAIPDDPQNFQFNLNNNSTISQDFALDDDADGTLPNSQTFSVPPGPWYASELMPLPSGWTLTNIVCVDPSSNTTVNVPAGTATINLASSETVTCTFTDTFAEATPSVTTEIHIDGSHAVVPIGGSVDLGTSVHDRAAVSTVAPFSAPTGTVTFTFYVGSACTTGAVGAGTVALDGSGVAHPSDSFGPLAAGAYAFQAHYNGEDPNYAPANSPCEPFSVLQRDLFAQITTEIHLGLASGEGTPTMVVAPIPHGSSVHDLATVTGGVPDFPLPDVTFYFFGDGATCTDGDTTNGTMLNTVSPDAFGVAHPSTDQADLAAGSYNFMAVVATNTNYIGATSDCEPFEVFDPSVTIDKSAEDLSKVGDSVTYLYTITNTSSANTPNLILDSLTDVGDNNNGAGLGDLTGLGGYDSDCDELAPGEFCTFSIVYTVQPGDDDPLDNEVTVVYQPAGFPATDVGDAEDWSVNLFQPDISVTKACTDLSKIGDPVTCTVVITNDSSSDTPDLEIDLISDSVQGDLTDALNYTSSTCGTSLAWDESCTIVYGYDVPGDADDPYLNTVTVETHPTGFLNDVDASAGDSVNLFQPSVAIDKTGDELSKVTDDVNYTITVENTSSLDSPNLSCTITDSLLGVNKNVNLAPGLWDVTHVSREVQAGDPDPLVNTASVTCTVDGFGNVIGPETDSHTTQLFQPSVIITKNGPATGFVGQTITYTYTITNDSSSDTPDLVLDSLVDTGDNNGGAGLGDLTGYASYDSDCDELAAGDVCTFFVDYTILSGDDNPLDNTVTALYHPDPFENDITDSDDHSVTILPPPGVGTPGFWLNHPEVWDGDTSNDEAFAGRNNFPPGDILYPVDSDGDGDIDGDDEPGILIGDWNRNGICDLDEDCIFLSLEDALDILDSSNQQQSNDRRLTLARALIATWLNIIAGNESDCIDESVDAGVDWLLLYAAPSGNPLEDGSPVKGKLWSQSGGEAIYLALDYYNNTGSTCALDRDIEIEVEKDWALTDDADLSGGLSEGDAITYTYVITNTGVAAVTDVAMADPHAGLSVFDCGAFVLGVSDLALGQSATCTATYVVTADDVAAGTIVNTATAIADAPNGHFLLDMDTLTIIFP